MAHAIPSSRRHAFGCSSYGIAGSHIPLHLSSEVQRRLDARNRPQVAVDSIVGDGASRKIHRIGAVVAPANELTNLGAVVGGRHGGVYRSFLATWWGPLLASLRVTLHLMPERKGRSSKPLDKSLKGLILKCSSY